MNFLLWVNKSYSIHDRAKMLQKLFSKNDNFYPSISIQHTISKFLLIQNIIQKPINHKNLFYKSEQTFDFTKVHVIFI